MKTTKVLLLGAVVTAFAFTSFAAEPLHLQRGSQNQIKNVSSSVDTPTVTIAHVETTPALHLQRGSQNQIKNVSSSVDTPTVTIAHVETTPALHLQRGSQNQIKIVTIAPLK